MGQTGPKNPVNKYHRPPENLEELKARAQVAPPTPVFMVDRITGQVYTGAYFQCSRVTMIDGPNGLIRLGHPSGAIPDERYDYVWTPRYTGQPVAADVDVEIRHCLPEGVEPVYVDPDVVVSAQGS